MKILKHGKLTQHIFTCLICECCFETGIGEYELYEDYGLRIFRTTCPECGNICTDTEIIEERKDDQNGKNEGNLGTEQR